MKFEQESGGAVAAEASEDFIQRAHGKWSPSDQEKLRMRLAHDPTYARAYHQVEQSWEALRLHAEAPEIIRYREEALAFARRTNLRRWMTPFSITRGRRAVAALAGLCVLGLLAVLELSPYGSRTQRLQTGVGEQRTIELADHSRVALDAVTQIRVRFSKDARLVELEHGQAQFTVAHDLARPFKVQAGGETIVALGTIFNVEYVERQVRVAMIDGRVAIVPATASVRFVPGPLEQRKQGGQTSGPPRGMQSALEIAAGTEAIELGTGEELRVSDSGRVTLTPKADIEAVSAWRAGKVIFRSETVAEAVRRMNRYSQLQIEIDDLQLAARQISGVFDAGDTQGFAKALQAYLPISLEYSNSKIIVQPR